MLPKQRTCGLAKTLQGGRVIPYAPPGFALMLSFARGGVYAPGKFWMPGSQSGVTHNLGRGKFAPSGAALSPP
jgi:hypothetical protein